MKQKVENLADGIKLEKVYFPGEYFLRGSPETEAERNENESPQHKVNLNPFYMSKYLITQEQYQVIMDEDPSGFKAEENHPVRKYHLKLN